MRIGFLGSVVVGGLLLAALGAAQLAVAQSREPTIDERYRDANSNSAETELPRLNAPQSKLAPPKPAAKKGSAAAYLGVIFAGEEQKAIVLRVAPGSPAEQAGLQPNDLIETVQGRQVRTNQDVLDIVAMLRPGDVLDIGFSRRMNIRTQAPLASTPTAMPRSVGYPPDLPASNSAAPEDPQSEWMPAPTNWQRNWSSDAPQSNRNSAQQNRNESSTGQRRNDNPKSNQTDENRRLLGRGLRLR